MLTTAHVDALRLFNDKAAKLGASTLARLLSTTGVAMTLHLGGDTEGSLDTGELTGEHVDAFALTARFFIQDNERTSFRNMAEIYGRLPVGDPLRDKFEAIRNTLNTALDGPPAIGLPGVRTRRQILETVMYGGLAHANPAKHADYQRWTQNFVFAGLVFNEFTGALTHLFVAVSQASAVNDFLLIREGA